MKKLFLYLMTIILSVEGKAQTYNINVSNPVNGTVTSSHTSASAGQIVAILASPSSGYDLGRITVKGNTSTPTVYESDGIVFNGDGTSFDGWIKTQDGGSGWAITDGNSFATSYELCTLEQTVTLTDICYSEAQLDEGLIATASVDMCATMGASVAQAIVKMLDVSGNEIGSVTVVDDLSEHDWQTYTKTFTLVSGTHQLKYILSGKDAVYWEGYYGPRFRNVNIITDVTPANKPSGTRLLRFVMPAEEVSISSVFEPSDPDIAFEGEDPLLWTSYRRSFSGNGTFASPYYISTAGQLAQLAYDVNNGNDYNGKIFVLAEDIDLEKKVDGEQVQWVPIGGRDGVFRGQMYGREYWNANAGKKCHVVKNMYINDSTTPEDTYNFNYYYGLFGQATNTLRDIIMTDAEISVVGTFNIANPNVGILCGSHTSSIASQTPPIYNCSVSGKIDVKTYAYAFVGGLAGKFDHPLPTAILNCTSEVSINTVGTSVRAGGIVGYLEEACITDCQAIADISCTRGYAGGICGYCEVNSENGGQISACVSSGSVGITGQGYAGGICGYANLTDIHSCVCMSTITGNTKATFGGICGYISSGSLSHSVFTGLIDGSKAWYAGGIVGYIYENQEEVVSCCLMTGTIKSTDKDTPCYAISGYVVNPLVVIANSYYDTTLCGLEALPTMETTHPTVKGLTTAEMTTGSQQDMTFLTSEDNYGFIFAKGYYPRVFNNESLLSESSQQYQRGAWLASLPLTMESGDLAYDLVATVTAQQKMGMWTELEFDPSTQQWESNEVRVNSSASLPKDASCIKVEGVKATVCDKGNFTMTVSVGSLFRPIHFDIVSYGTPWDGTIADGIATGTGSPSSPYIIRTPEELAYAVNNNRADACYRQICDIWLNERMIDSEEEFILQVSEPRKNRHTWFSNTTWNGIYDGTNHYIRGLYFMLPQDIKDEAWGLFGTVTTGAEVKNLGVIDVSMQCLDFQLGTLDAYDNCHNSIGVLAGICDGHIRNCLTQGAIDTFRRVYSKVKYAWHFYMKMDYIGGLCGRVGVNNDEALVEDCVSAVTFLTGYSVAGAFTTRFPEVNRGMVSHSLSLSPQLYYGYYVDANGVAYDQATESLGESDCLNDCHYPKGFRYTGPSTDSSPASGDDIATLNEAFSSSNLWVTDDEYYPMLTAFSKSFGKLLTLPFTPEEGDNIADVHQQVTFNPGNLHWQLFNNGSSQYFELDSDMGVLSPLRAMNNYYEKVWMPMMYGQTPDEKEFVIIQFGTSYTGVKPGITFKDENARLMCVENFDRNSDGNITLSELGSVTNDETLTAFQTSNAPNIKEFPEFRYFKAVNNLTTQLQSMHSLESIQLPFALDTITADAFNGCSSLKEVTIPARVETLGAHPFYGSGVENIYVDKFNESFQSRDGLLFDNDNRLICYPNGRTGSATLEGDITEIGPNAIYKLTDCDTIFIDAPNYWDVVYLNAGGIETIDGSLPMIYVKDATYDQTLLDSYLYDDSWWDYAETGHIGRYYPLTVTSAKAATLYIGFDTHLPANLKPYIVTTTNDDEKVAHLTRLTDNSDHNTQEVPMLTPVVIFADAPGVYNLFPLFEELEPFPMWKNLLIGSDRNGMPVYQEDAARVNILTLGRNASRTLGFYFYTGEQIPPYRAYLSSNDISNIKSFRIVIDPDDETTEINDIYDSENSSSAAVDSGDHQQWYNLNGQRVNPQHLGKGIYIINGKKVLIQ